MSDGDSLPIYVPLLFIAVPIGIVIIGVALFVHVRRQSKRLAFVPDGWARAAGLVTSEITRFERRGYGADSSSVFIRQPIVTYRTSRGQDITFTSTITGTYMPKPGTHVTVCHDPADPSRARIAPESIPKINKAISATATVFVLLIGVPLVSVFVLIGVVLLRTR